jgi:hypothetical protein
MGVKEVSAHWSRAGRALKSEENQICGQKLSDMAKNIPVIVDHNWPLKDEQSVQALACTI